MKNKKELGVATFFVLMIIILKIPLGNAEVVWSDDFDDGDLHGWFGVMGQLSAENGSLHSIVSGEIVTGYELLSGAYHPITVAVGTWSFDFLSDGSRAPEFAVEFISLGQYKWEVGEEMTECYGFYAGWFLEGKYELYKDVQFPSASVLQLFSPSYSIPNEWHHVDITRSEDGRIVVYVDGELTHDVVDKDYKESKYFGVHLEHSDRGTAYIDNIVVSNTVDIEPPRYLDASVEISEEEVTQGEDVLVTIQVKDDYGVLITDASVDVIIEEKMVDVSEVSWGVYQAVLDTSEYLGRVELVVTVEKSGFIPSAWRFSRDRERAGQCCARRTHHFEVVASASFVTGSLSIEPSTVQIGETVAISVDVSNVGGQEGSHLAVLKVNGVVEDEHETSLEPDGSETVIFEHSSTQSGVFTVDVDGISGSFTVVEPASFELGNLIIEPTSVKEGESISISVDCMNTGGLSGSYDVILEVDGRVEDTSTVTLDAAESTTVNFDISAIQSGTYSVEIGGLTGSYTVEKLQRGIPGFPLESVIIGLVIGVFLIWMWQRKTSTLPSFS